MASDDGKSLKEYIRTHPFKGPFKPGARYNVDGHFIEVWFEDADCYLDSGVYRAMDGQRIVGCKINFEDIDGISRGERSMANDTTADLLHRQQTLVGARLKSAYDEIASLRARADALEKVLAELLVARAGSQENRVRDRAERLLGRKHGE